MTSNGQSCGRSTVFISKATPGDDEFVLWLGPRLEAAGYTVFADILSLEPGDRWRKRVTRTLQEHGIKMLLCCRDATLDKDGVQEEIGIASDLSEELKDPRFIIPLRLEKFKKLFGIGEIQYVDFVGSWANGLRELLDTLQAQSVPCDSANVVITPNWETYRKRFSIRLEQETETLTSNWLRIAGLPDTIRYYEPTGAINHLLLQRACEDARFPAEFCPRGFFSFAEPQDIASVFEHIGPFVLQSEIPLGDFLAQGSRRHAVGDREAKNFVLSLLRKSWNQFCRSRGLREYAYAEQLGFHVTQGQIELGKRVPWGPVEQRRSSMLRNVLKNRVWEYGVSAFPQLWPYPHFRLKARVLFAEQAGREAGALFSEVDEQFRLRRSLCKGWRNKQWHGRLMALLQLLSVRSEYIDLPLSSKAPLRLFAAPILFTAPITTRRLDAMEDEDEEADPTTLGDADAEEG